MARTSSIIAQLFVLPVAFAVLHVASFLHAQGAAKSQANSPEIRVDTVLSDFAELRRKAEALESTSCNGHNEWLNAPTTVDAFVGGKVKGIHVVRFVHATNFTTREEVRNTITKVWQGKFQSASCQVDWDEGTFWSIEAIVEFEDGKQSALITDGSHVATQDHDGKNWFLRLLPAAR